MSGPSERDEVAEVLAAHQVSHRAHVADALTNLLAERDRRVAAKTLREAADAGESFLGNETGVPWDYLRDRADRIERGE